MHWAKPLPSSPPRRHSSVTSTSSKKISPVGHDLHPIFPAVGPVLKRLTPRAGMLGTLAGIVIIFFGLGALMQRKETKLDVAFESAPQPVSNGLPTEFTGTGSEE